MSCKSLVMHAHQVSPRARVPPPLLAHHSTHSSHWTLKYPAHTSRPGATQCHPPCHLLPLQQRLDGRDGQRVAHALCARHVIVAARQLRHRQQRLVATTAQAQQALHRGQLAQGQLCLTGIVHLMCARRDDRGGMGVGERM
jgi:hypothetical protein